MAARLEYKEIRLPLKEAIKKLKSLSKEWGSNSTITILPNDKNIIVVLSQPMGEVYDD